MTITVVGLTGRRAAILKEKLREVPNVSVSFEEHRISKPTQFCVLTPHATHVDFNFCKARNIPMTRLREGGLEAIVNTIKAKATTQASKQ